MLEPQHEKAPRPVQPKCATVVNDKPCNHALSFHGAKRERCRALGCHCPVWTPPSE